MQNSFLNLLVITVSLFTISAFTKEKEPVYFLPEKNNLQILPQKFEYNLLNSSTIKIGDIVIDSNNLSLELALDRSQYQFIFNWPAGLFEQAELVLFNNYGKAIQTYEIKKENIELAKDDPKEGEKSEADSLLRKDKAIFKTSIETVLLDEIKYLPFFKFCLQRKEESTRIDLCSVELYLSSKDGKPTIKMRSENKKRAQILINNAEVGEQGIIFLNDISESINFIGQSESGAKLEIETRLRPVDFKDIIISDDGKSLSLTSQGSRPVSEKNVTNLTNSMWQIKLPADFPVFYIQGEGGIPFRQEFFVRGALPTESLRTNSTDLINETYSSSEKMTLELPKGVTISSKDTNSKVSKNGQKIEWNVTSLEKGQDNKRILYLKKDKNEYAIYQSIYRAAAFEAHLGATYVSAEKVSFGNLGLNYWITKRSGLSLTMDQALTKTDAIDKWTITEFSYSHRLTAGMNFRDPSFFGSVGLRSMSLGNLSFSQIGLGIGQKTMFTSSLMNTVADWYKWNFNYYLGSKSNEIEIKSLMTADYKLYLQLTHSFYFNYGLGIQSISMSDENSLKSTQVNVNLGLNYLF
ncbi:MAG: hypothetical protein JNM24_15080 [Bdellovibrionaceae bacterium]|nr:hypothetical protein [Pseudobdellovibrionaceae bacterium]